MYVRPRPRFRPRNAGSGNTPSLALEFNQLSALPSYVTFSRGTQAMQYGSDGTLQYAPNNLLTYSNQADNAAWTKSNSFVQTNLQTYSQDFDNAAWAKTTAGTGSTPVVTPNVFTAPDGTLTADLITLNLNGGNTLTDQSILTGTTGTTVTSATYNGSIYVIAATSADVGKVLAFRHAGAATYSLITLTAAWQRFSVNETAAGIASSINVGLRGGTGASTGAVSFYAWGAQLVQGSVPGDYRATTSAALPVLYADYNGALRARKLCEDSVLTTHEAKQDVATLATQYTFSAYVKAGERTFAMLYHGNSNSAQVIDLTTGAASGNAGLGAPLAYSINSLGSGWYRVAITVTATAAANNFRVYPLTNATTYNYTGNGSSGIYIADAQLTPGYLPLAVTETTSVAVYGPRFDYDPVTKVARGLLIEEQRVNLLLQSNTFNVTWTASTNTNVTAAAGTSPEGVVNAWRLYGSNGLVPGGLFQAISKAAAATQYTWSIYAKPAGYNWLQLAVFDGTADGNRYWFNLSTGVLGSTAVIGAGFTGVSATITNIGNGWYRCTLTATSNTAVQYNGYAYPTNGDGVTTAGNAFTDGTFIYGAQLEAGAFATSYIPTVGSTATRNADSATIPASTWYNTAAGTWYFNGETQTFPRYLIVDNSGAAKYPMYVHSAAGGIGNFDGTNLTLTANNTTAGTTFKAATTYTGSSATAVLNAGTVASGTYNGAFSTIATFKLGAATGPGGEIDGHIRSIRYYPTALPNASLQSITV